MLYVTVLARSDPKVKTASQRVSDRTCPIPGCVGCWQSGMLKNGLSSRRLDAAHASAECPCAARVIGSLFGPRSSMPFRAETCPSFGQASQASYFNPLRECCEQARDVWLSSQVV